MVRKRVNLICLEMMCVCMIEELSERSLLKRGVGCSVIWVGVDEVAWACTPHQRNTC